jgi:Cu2+-exporting ATPase
VSVLIVTCPCALSLATPSALLAAAGGLARRGVLLRRLEALETMARCDHLVIDKTGTLTEDRPRFVGCERLESAACFDGESLVDLAAALAAWSRHPLAQALAHARSPAIALAWRAVREEPGAGIEGRDAQGRAWRLGRREWVEGEALIADAGDDDSADQSRMDRGAGLEAWFGPVGEPMARLRFDETLRPDVCEALTALRADGLRITLLSGDVQARVARMGALLGIDEVHGGASPADKLNMVRAAQARGEGVVMVGDGINDAPVLAQADVSIAMGAGALLARGEADSVLLADRLSGVLDLRRTSRRCLRVIRQNIAWAAAYNVICIPVALAGWLPPWAAGLGMASSSLLVVVNALRLRN